MGQEQFDTPADKGQRSHKGPAILTKLLIRRSRYREENVEASTEN